MKKILKKNQLIITALVVLVAVAGYLSMTEKEEMQMLQNNQSITDEEVTTMSEEDIVLDSGEDSQAVTTSAVSASAVASRENPGEAVLVSNIVGNDYFSEAKLSREQTRAKNKETLTALVNNDNTSSEQKDKALEEIMEMTEVSEKETATENLLAAKGFQEAVVTIMEDSVDVIVNAEELTVQQIAQIEDVVKRKSGYSADKIVISPVGKNE